MATKLEKQLQKLLKKARAQVKKGNGAKALDLYRQACDISRYEVDAWNERAELAEQEGDSAEAAECLFHLADMHARSGQGREAAALAQRVLALDPKHGGARHFLRMFSAYVEDEAPSVAPAHDFEEETEDFAYSEPAPEPESIPAPAVAASEAEWSAARGANRDHSPPDDLQPVLELEALEPEFDASPPPYDVLDEEITNPVDQGTERNAVAIGDPEELDESQFEILDDADEDEDETLNTLVRSKTVSVEDLQLGNAGGGDVQADVEEAIESVDVELGKSGKMPRLDATEVDSEDDSGVGPIPGNLTADFNTGKRNTPPEHRISHHSARLAVSDIEQSQPQISSEPDLDLVEAVAETIPISPLLSELDSDLVKLLIDNSRLVKRAANEAVFEEGDTGTHLYLILRGEVFVERLHDGKPHRVATLRPGAFFGEMSLLTDAPRSATVRAANESSLLEVSRDAMREIVERQGRVRKLLMRFFRARMVGSLMVSSELFKPFSVEDRRKLVTRFRLRELPPGQVVLEQGTRGDGLYLVLAGAVEVVAMDGEREIHLDSLAAGQVFGEISLLEDSDTVATVRAHTRAWVLRLPRDDFRELIASYPKVLDRLNTIAEARKQRNLELLSQKSSA